MSAISDTRADVRTSSPPAGSTRRGGRAGRTRSGGRTLTAIVVLVSFIAMSLLQHVTQRTHHELVKNTGSEAKLSNLNSFSLALLLGGLRGPLVMLLWTSSETQKQQKELQDFDSKVELIRLLQPEFDSVHIFQIWNKAYNISVQMANKANKYLTILDALQYAYNVNAQHHDDLNILSQVGQIFFDKLGNSAEKEFYIDRVRRESFVDVVVMVPAGRVEELDAILFRAALEPARREVLVAQAKKEGRFTINKLTADAIRPLLHGEGVSYGPSTPVVFNATNHRIRLDPLLDLDGNFLPDKVTPKTPRPADLPAGADWNDGSEMQYLKRFEPFPYGVPPMAIGVNYYKQCQVIRDTTHQKHLQLSDLVVDNRPAINTKLWGETEWTAGRKAERRAFGQQPKDEKLENELPTAMLSPTTAISGIDAAREAIYHYRLAVKIADMAQQEFVRHVRRFPAAEGGFRSHRETMEGMRSMCLADAAYLEAMLLPAGAEREERLKEAVKDYTDSLHMWERVMIGHYVAPELFAESAKRLGFKDITPETLDKLSPADLHRWAATIAIFLSQNPVQDVNDDRQEVEQYIRRSFQRLANLHAEPKGDEKP